MVPSFASLSFDISLWTDGSSAMRQLAGRDRVLHLRVEDLEVERHLRGAVRNVLDFARRLFQVEVEVD